jgi:hypothetical protein
LTLLLLLLLLLLASAPAAAALLLLLLSESDAQPITYVLKLHKALTTLNNSRHCCTLNCSGTCQRLLPLLLLLGLNTIICCSRHWSFNCAALHCCPCCCIATNVSASCYGTAAAAAASCCCQDC